MVNLPKELQQKNFYDVMQKMISISGWSILEKNNLLALKSGANIPLINFVWGDVTIKNINIIKSFYQQHSFTWLLMPNQNDELLISAGFSGPEPSPEMVLYLDKYRFEEYESNMQVKVATSNEELDLWAQVASETFGISAFELKEFFEPLIKVAGAIPFLIYYDNIPATTSLVYCYDQVAGIYAMSTRENFRRKGLGGAAVQACLKEAKNNNISYAVLYASQMGKPLYESMGFQVSQVLEEYVFEINGE
jgi:ribosomal protein S18 acetylase RimI-like enzyme